MFHDHIYNRATIADWKRERDSYLLEISIKNAELTNLNTAYAQATLQHQQQEQLLAPYQTIVGQGASKYDPEIAEIKEKIARQRRLIKINERKSEFVNEYAAFERATLKKDKKAVKHYHAFMEQFDIDECKEALAQNSQQLQQEKQHLSTTLILKQQQKSTFIHAQLVAMDEAKLAQHVLEKKRLDQQIETITKQQHYLLEGIQSAEAKLALHRQNHPFMVDVIEHPEAKFKRLTSALEKTLAVYEEDYPCDQSKEVRQILVEMRYFLRDNDYSYQNSEQEVKHADPTDFERKVYQCYGLIETTLRSIHYPCCNKKLGRMVLDSCDGDNVKLDASESMEAYQQWRNTVQLPSHEQLAQDEKREYEDACAQLKAAKNDAHPTCYAKAMNVLNAIESRKAKAIQKNKNFDYKYNTRLIKDTHELLNNPSDQTLQVKYRKLIKHERDDNPSTCNKVLGGMLMFLGAVLVVVCSLIPNPAGIVVGVGAALFGVGFFRQGMLKGTAKDMTGMAIEAGKMTSLNRSSRLC